MGWLTQFSSTDRKISQMHNLLARSFSNVKRDTQNLFQWLNFLHQKNVEQQQQIKHLETQLSYIPKRPEDIKKIVDSYYSFDNMMDRMKLLNEKIDNLHMKAPESTPISHPGLQHIEIRLKNLEEQRKATIREKVVNRVSKNSKDYVKSLILSYIRKYGQISGLQLKEMIVHDQGLCSKSSFYRLLEEVEEMEDIGAARKGKQKFYLYKPLGLH